ncbi:Heat shock protein DnaJ, N-terminal [Penicillium italicum]|uniref:Heat shock protein DnaJ, N-terminal n=1 Tax=Penicillium italicum TaxID=40296 RepID=A0A0A2KH59_PENIT|nr:Heat shock protein DnaJ, N-terminal [Penicillium italicum]
MSTASVIIDAYAILGVERDAKLPDINIAYKRLALKLHPDKAGNTAATIERFRKIQDAVEVLRDEDRRRLLDESLKKKAKRHLDPEDDTSTWAYKRNLNRPSKRECHGHDFHWPGSFAESSTHKPRPQHQHNYSYYYSYGTSVHMDPDSAESKARCAQFQAENVEWENEWAGIDPEVQKARAELRKENMRARMKRDLADMAKDQDQDSKFADMVDQVVEGVLNELNFGHDHKFEDFVHVMPEENIKTCNPTDTFDEFAYEYAKKFRSDSEDPAYSDCASSPPYAASNDSSFDFSTSSNSTDCNHPANKYSNFQSTTVEDHESTTDDSDSDFKSEADKLINSYMVGHDSLLPLVSFLKQKLADPHGRYTLNDLGGELNGIMLETYCGWLEEVRLSVPNASPLTVRSDPKLCSHLGLWYKDFCRPVCNVCNLWMPSFILTCPGCGMKACVRCKFTGGCDSPLGSVMQEQ